MDEHVEIVVRDTLGSGPSRPKVYLDTAIISAWIKQDIPSDEFEALQLVLVAFHDGKIDLCTSHVAGEELSKLPEGPRRTHRLVYDFIRRVPAIAEVKTNNSGLLLRGVGGGSRPDPLYAELVSFLSKNDARHVFQAIKNGVNVFLTVDGGILSSTHRIAAHGLHALSPVGCVRELGL